MTGLTMTDKFDGIIFDVDGTLWDSTDVVKDAWNAAIVEAGYPFPNITADRLKGLFGLPMVDIIEDIMPQLNEQERIELEPRVYKYEDEFLQKTPGVLYEGIVDTIRKIAKSTPVYIISNCQAGYIELFMEKTDTASCIKDFSCPAYTGKLKADNIKLMIEKHSIKNPLYVGDTIMDQKACITADCPFCFAEYGFGVSENPEYTITKPAQLLEVLGIE